MLPRLFLVRHGETAWSITGQHTGRTDIPLTARGEEEVLTLVERLRGESFSRVFASPLQRARRTCELAGLGARAELEPDLLEWDYGAYDGLRLDEIRQQRPDWEIYRDGCPRGEMPEQISARADQLVARLRKLEGNIAIFSHGHFGRVLAARWVGWPIAVARPLRLNTASVSILGHGQQHPDEPAIELWNSTGK